MQVEDDDQGFGSSNWKNGSAIYQAGKTEAGHLKGYCLRRWHCEEVTSEERKSDLKSEESDFLPSLSLKR